MDFQKNLNHQSMWARQSCVSLLGSAETQWFLITNNLLFCRLSSQLCTGFVRGLSFSDILRRIFLQRCLIFWHMWPKTYLPGHLGGGLVLGSTVLVCQDSRQTFIGCVPFRERLRIFQDDVLLRCNLEINKVFFF